MTAARSSTFSLWTVRVSDVMGANVSPESLPAGSDPDRPRDVGLMLAATLNPEPTPGVFEHRYVPRVEYDEDGREVWTPPLPAWTLTEGAPT